jgi:hypothetical protein
VALVDISGKKRRNIQNKKTDKLATVSISEISKSCRGASLTSRRVTSLEII